MGPLPTGSSVAAAGAAATEEGPPARIPRCGSSDGPARGFGQVVHNRGILGARGAGGGGQPPPAGHPRPPAGAILRLRGPAATSWQRPRLALEAKRNRHQTLRVPQSALLFCVHRRYFTSVVPSPIDLALERMCIQVQVRDDPGPGRLQFQFSPRFLKTFFPVFCSCFLEKDAYLSGGALIKSGIATSL